MRIFHFSCAIALTRIFVALLMLAATQVARGDVLDGVELERRGPNADISIRFTVPVQYLRHQPLDAGKTLRIFPRFTGTTVTTASPDTFRLPETDMVPRFTVTYSSTDNSLVIDFDQPTRFSVRSGTDGRSIVITVPTLPGAKDWALQASPAPRAPAPPPVAAAPAAAPVTPPAPPAPVPKAPSAAASTAQAPPAAQQPPAAPAPKPAPATGAPIVPAAPTVPLAKEEVESQAAKLMAAAQLAIDAQRGVAAAERLNQVLALPPNSHTEKAQALMGEAREYSGESIKARAEYEQYLKLYPNGSHAPRVKERLAALGKTLSQTSAALGLKPVTDGGAPWTIFGGLSQYYYTGHTQIETITPPPPGQLLFNRDNLSLTDQRSLITNLDIQARRRDAVTDTRFVFRDTDNRNFLNNSRSYNRVNSAYVEQTNKEYGYFVRAGRQTGTGNGAPGRFDGVNAGYNLNPEWRINGIVGEPVEFNSEFHRQMYGMSVDYTAQLGKPGGSVYFIEQSLEGVRDRRAVGTELRYFDPNLTMFGTLEYEIDYRRMNLAMMQANLRTDAGTNYFANIDIRKSPPLGLLTALPGQISLDPFAPTLSFRSLFFDSVNTLGVDELRRQSTILTATSYLYSLGFTHPVTPRWQLGADYRNASISGTGESGIVAAAPASGTSHVFSGQALGNGILVENDSTVANVSLIAAPTYAGQAYSVSYGIPYQAWRLDATMRLYTQTDDQDQRQTRISPTLKVAYRWRNKVSFEVEAGLEKFTESGPLRETNSRRYYIFGGYRWDFQ